MALNAAEHIRITLDHGFGDGLHVLVIATDRKDLGAQPFEDYSSRDFTFSMARVQRDLFGWATLSGYYAYFTLDNSKYLTVSGYERRDIIDVRRRSLRSFRSSCRPSISTSVM
jgi:hypothetical protein